MIGQVLLNLIDGMCTYSGTFVLSSYTLSLLCDVFGMAPMLIVSGVSAFI